MALMVFKKPLNTVYEMVCHKKDKKSDSWTLPQASWEEKMVVWTQYQLETGTDRMAMC